MHPFTFNSFLTLQQTSSSRPMNSSVFQNVQKAPPDPILGVSLAYKADTDPNKMDVGVGAYRDDNEKPYVFHVVKKAEEEIINDKSLNKEYLPIDGLAGFNEASQKLMFGADSSFVKEGKIVTV